MSHWQEMLRRLVTPQHRVRLGVVGKYIELQDAYKSVYEAIIHGAVKRVRPKMMTVTAAFMGLMPIMWSIGTGADVMKRIAAPMIGGIFTSFIMELVVYPAIYAIWKWHFEVKPTLKAAAEISAGA